MTVSYSYRFQHIASGWWGDLVERVIRCFPSRNPKDLGPWDYR